ncbi:hypothetical protein [Streptomyces roseolus]|uniref:hypothetical protein n=1 Tax=Streptomyces roseolus TaxID=67358 RepID=UPI0036665404
MVLNSLDEARELDRAALDADGRDSRGGAAGTEGAGATVTAPGDPRPADLAERIAEMRQSLDLLERSLTATHRTAAVGDKDRMATIA